MFSIRSKGNKYELCYLNSLLKEMENNGQPVFLEKEVEKYFNSMGMSLPTKLSTESEIIDLLIVAKIREYYNENEEFKMINLGIADSQNTEYIKYRQHVEECISWGRREKEKNKSNLV